MMVRLPAISIGGSLASGLQAREITGTVHSAFRRAVNLQDGTGEIISILAAELGNTPRGVLVDLPDEANFRSIGVAPGSGFRASAEAISSGPLCVSLRSARLWDPEPPVPLLPEHGQREQLYRMLEVVVRELGSRDGLWGTHFPTGPEHAGPRNRNSRGQSLPTAWSVLAAPGIQRLVSGWRHGDLGQASCAAAELLGLGPGLTPAGDDFLGGCLALLALATSTPAERDLVARLGEAILGAARTRTHAISYTMLSDSAKGQPAERVRELISALLTLAPTKTREAAIRLLRCGSSSGTDAALGILTGFQMLLVRA